MLGGFCGACLVWLFYKDHFDATADDPAAVLGCFCTAPAIRNPKSNFFSEMVATFVLVFLIFCVGTYKIATPGGVGAWPVTMIIVSIGMSLGATTGYAMNAARDLAPRLAHALLPVKGKQGSDWEYAWIPVAGPLAGAALAALVYLWVF